MVCTSDLTDPSAVPEVGDREVHREQPAPNGAAPSANLVLAMLGQCSRTDAIRSGPRQLR